MGVGVQRHAPAALPPGKTRYLIGSNESNSAQKLQYA